MSFISYGWPLRSHKRQQENSKNGQILIEFGFIQNIAPSSLFHDRTGKSGIKMEQTSKKDEKVGIGI